MGGNHYERCLTTDNNYCLPVITQEQIAKILWTVDAGACQELGEGARPQLDLDLEHLQVVDYGAFDDVNDEQRQRIKTLHRDAPIRPEEMVYLALRSLFGFSWPKPQSEDDIRRAASYEFRLNKCLVSTALELSSKFSLTGALLPYWGRLSFLRVMSKLPTENVQRYHLDRVACTLIKRQKFNATTFMAKEGPLIGLNVALEPILKHLNRYILHYFHSEDMAGAARLGRAWTGIAPTVLHFWADVSASRLTGSSSILFDVEMTRLAHALTADQVDFILMHELGHIALDHPQRLQRELTIGENTTTIRHECEFVADAFAFGLLRSRIINTLRYSQDPNRRSRRRAVRSSLVSGALQTYQSHLCAVYLLFTYMEFIERAGLLLKNRLGNRIKFREHMDSHPTASARLDRLELANLGELLYTSQLIRYTKGLFENILNYADGLDDETLFGSIHEMS